MLPLTTQGMISIKTLSKLAQLRHEGVMLVRANFLLVAYWPEVLHSAIPES